MRKKLMPFQCRYRVREISVVVYHTCIPIYREYFIFIQVYFECTIRMVRIPFKPDFFFMLSFCNCLSCVVTARIFLLFDLSSAVQIYVSYIYIHLFILHGYITNSQYDQLPVGLIAQLVEHCTCMAAVMGSNPVKA